jgi:hypothetical protein
MSVSYQDRNDTLLWKYANKKVFKSELTCKLLGTDSVYRMPGLSEMLPRDVVFQHVFKFASPFALSISAVTTKSELSIIKLNVKTSSLVF